jgi:mannose-6-phosphate isomerase-like protein (cupin superfamily)
MLDGETHQLNPGDCCIVLQGHRFSYENTTQETAKIILIHTPSFDLKSEVFV